jgi:hypothetical protein
MIDVLLAAGADVNARSQWWAGGFGLLHTADPELAAYAIERGAVVDVHAAARLGRLDRLRELIEGDPRRVHARGGDGQTPLHFARTVEIAAYLLDHGADIDARDIDHESTPAQYMLGDRPDVARYLVQRGCTTDILLAAAVGDLDRVRMHLDADPSCIRLRASEEFFPMVNPKAGGTIYQWTLGYRASAYQAAAKFGHADVLRLLMERSLYLPDICPTAFLAHWKSRSDLCFGSLIRTYVVQRHDICPDLGGATDRGLLAPRQRNGCLLAVPASRHRATSVRSRSQRDCPGRAQQ